MSAVHPPIRLIAIDLDGTLLDDRKQIGRQTAAALESLPRRGAKVVIASARPPRSVRHIYAALKLDTLQINYNGALIWDEPAKQAAFHLPMPGRIVRRIIEHARQLDSGVLVHCELLDRWYTDRHDSAHTTETGRLFAPDVVAPLKEFWDVSMTKVLLLGAEQIMTDLEASLAMTFEREVSVVRTDPDLLQIMEKRVSKAAAVQTVAEHYNIPMEQVMAIGDAPNDVGMLRVAGIGVAMGNAHSLVKQAAHWIAPSNNDNGVHAALVHYGLCD
jgi:5-amino-6-(5-phospho-D-ribitylamino)uracil phosphatase